MSSSSSIGKFIFGSNNDDILEGGDGNDTIIGNKGNDLKIGGRGNDRLIWNDGDGSDTMEGGKGYDVVEVNGAVNDGDSFELRANGHRAEFERLNLGNFVLNVDDVEKFKINGLGGDDTLTVRDLSATDINKVVFNGGDGDDYLDASLSNVKIVADGGDGDDYLSGSSVPEIADTLKGNDGNDTIVGNKGNDRMRGGRGDDRLIWNNGDGSDKMRGDRGFDVVEVNGAVDDGDDFELRANGDRVEFERLNLGNFVLDVDDVEQFEINALGGDDTLTVRDLTGTDVQQVIFNGGDGDDYLDGEETSTQIISEGGVGNDTLISGTADDTLDGGVGDDAIEGEQGNDTMIGGEGNDTLEWDDGDGSDLMSGGTGIDTIEVEGSLTEGDDFVLEQDGEKAIFDRVNLGLFTLTVDTSEIFEVEGEGGNDIFTVGDLSNTDVEKVTFEGGEGNDFLDASLTNVEIIADGGDGDDTLIGGNADDTLIGGNDNNTYTGGEGADVFVVGFDGIDIINDFNRGEGDIIQISMMEFGASSLDGFSYDSSSKELSYQGTQFAAIDPVEPFSIMDDITLVE